jgi:uncharacterized LabA/DUF88 family protein
MDKRVAVYWDFENIHASLCTIKFDSNWYKDNRQSQQSHLVDINAIMEYVAGLGQVNINKAYANWSWLYNYNFDLQDHSVDLVQLFPRGQHGKNGADIRMAIDIIEDVTLHSHITTVVVVGGDSDYISIAQKVRQRGRSIIGIGVKETTNQYWAKSCNEFKFYSSLLVKSSSIAALETMDYESSDIAEAKYLLRKAISRLISQSGESSVKKAAVKPMMQRLEPSFDESNYGFSSFTNFLDACKDTVQVTPGKQDHIVALRPSVMSQKTSSVTMFAAHPYEQILRQQQIRLPNMVNLKIAIQATCEIFSDLNEVVSYADYQSRLVEKMTRKGLIIKNDEAAKIKQILYKAFSFERNLTTSSIKLKSDISTADNLYRRVLQALTSRILDNIERDRTDIVVLSRLLFGDSNHINEIRNLMSAYFAAKDTSSAR